MRTALCFGDSNTHGTIAMRTPTDRRRHPLESRWTSVLARQLKDSWHIIPEGHPGRTSVFNDPIEGHHKNGLSALKAILESHRPLDLVVLMLGTNDLKARFSVSAHDIALGLQRLVAEVNASDCGPDGKAPRVLLVAPVAVLEVGIFDQIFAGANQKSKQLPALIETIAQNNAAAFLDANRVATVDPVDGIHLDTTAHDAIGKALAETISDLFN